MNREKDRESNRKNNRENSMEHNRQVYCLPPCPSYDVEGMEKWLSDQAKKGLLLGKDGIFAGIATFEKGEPCHAKYRLEAAQKSTSMWADNGGEPDPEQIALSEKYAWEYVAKRGDFYIYRSFDSEARELNTDPDVQALALNAVKIRLRASAFNLIFWAVIYPVLFLRGGILFTIIHMRTWVFVLTAIFVLWMIADEVKELVSLQSLQKKLREDGYLQSDKDWQKGAVSYHGKRAAKIVLAIALICIFLSGWSDSVLNTNKMEIEKYDGTWPFATMRDIAEEDIVSYRMTMTGLNMGFNVFQEWSDFLAPRCIEYNEHAQMTLSNGRIVEGGYYVDYFEAKNPWIARRLAKEMYTMDCMEKNFETMDPLPIDVACDGIYVYKNNLHFPTAILQQGSKVVRVYLFQTSADSIIPIEEWIPIVAKSIAD